MNIHQLSVTYVQEQDRILLRVNTGAGEELRVWLTRRLSLGLWPMLGKIVAEHTVKQEAIKSPELAGALTQDEPTRRALADFKREENLQSADFKTPYRDQPAALPLGPEPLLVTEVNITPLANGQLQISFAEKLQGAAPRGFQMALESQMIHGLLHLLEKALRASQWEAPAAAPEPAAAAEEPKAEKPRYLN